MLHITNSDWRKAMYRSAEAMTLFSLVVAAIMVMVHVGRPWFIHWAAPYPEPDGAVAQLSVTAAVRRHGDHDYLTGSTIFIYMGSIPDFAAVRDRTTGWRNTCTRCCRSAGAARDTRMAPPGWAYTFLAVLIIPLAVSVHSIVSWDFAMSIVPALHQTIFAPYFRRRRNLLGHGRHRHRDVLLRKYMNFEQYITQVHFDNLGKLLLVLSLIWTYINMWSCSPAGTAAPRPSTRR